MFLLWILVLIGIPLLLRLRTRVATLESEVARQHQLLQTLSEQLRRARRDVAKPEAEEKRAPAKRGPSRRWSKSRRLRYRQPIVAPSSVPPPAEPPPASDHAACSACACISGENRNAATVTTASPRREPPPLPPEPPPAPAFAIDWEAFVGVKLFSAIAGIALVLAAVFFLRYSIEQGWLGPQIRVAIGVDRRNGLARRVRAEGRAQVRGDRQRARRRSHRDSLRDVLRRACAVGFDSPERDVRTARPRHRARGHAVDPARVAIHRRTRFCSVDSATPALLSTGENRPIPLFTYLLILNAGLAWVAFKKGWPLLTILTLILTAIYQWGWVIKFLDSGQLSLAMGIFLVFSVMSFVALILGRRGLERSDAVSKPASCSNARVLQPR
jgi:uncharacterized membrane protein